MPNATYFCSYNMGVVTDISKVYSVLEEVKQQFKANEYSLINQNCNHFTEAFCQALLKKSIPSYINRLARMGSWTAFILPRSLKSLNPIPDGS